MQNIGTLQTAQNARNNDAQSKRALAETLLKEAEAHEANGDEVSAQQKRDSADRYNADADRFEQESASFELEILRRRRELDQIEKKQEELTANYNRDMQKLEQDKSLLS